MLKRFFYASAAVLMLALAYHLGAGTAGAQAPSNPVVATFGPWTVVTANGDVYYAPNGVTGPWVLYSNVFAGGPTPALHQSWGQVKARYHAAPGMGVTPGADSTTRRPYPCLPALDCRLSRGWARDGRCDRVISY